MPGISDPAPTDDEKALAEFTKALIACPSDATTRLVFADWLDEHGDPKRAKYLREIRQRKFLKLYAQVGTFAFYPPAQMPPRVADRYRYWTDPPPARSDRCRAWEARIRHGWRMPKWVQGKGYDPMAGYFGVYVWEWLNVLSPLYDATARLRYQTGGS